MRLLLSICSCSFDESADLFKFRIQLDGYIIDVSFAAFHSPLLIARIIFSSLFFLDYLIWLGLSEQKNFILEKFVIVDKKIRTFLYSHHHRSEVPHTNFKFSRCRDLENFSTFICSLFETFLRHSFPSNFDNPHCTNFDFSAWKLFRFFVNLIPDNFFFLTSKKIHTRLGRCCCVQMFPKTLVEIFYNFFPVFFEKHQRTNSRAAREAEKEKKYWKNCSFFFYYHRRVLSWFTRLTADVVEALLSSIGAHSPHRTKVVERTLRRMWEKWGVGQSQSRRRRWRKIAREFCARRSNNIEYENNTAEHTSASIRGWVCDAKIEEGKKEKKKKYTEIMYKNRLKISRRRWWYFVRLSNLKLTQSRPLQHSDSTT